MVERTFTPEKVPLKEPTEHEQVMGGMDLILQRMQTEEGLVPNFVVYEFAIVDGAQYTIKADYNLDRWVVFFRATSNAELRVYPGDNCPPANSVEIASGQAATLTAKDQNLSFLNIGGEDIAAVFVVGIGGGFEFDITAI